MSHGSATMRHSIGYHFGRRLNLHAYLVICYVWPRLPR